MKRLGIFLFYDAEGRVSEHMKLSLRAFRPHMQDVVFVANGALDESTFPEADELVTHVLKRENNGFDVWGYKEGLEYIGFDNFADYDEIVLFNYTFFAPFHDLEIMFSDMAERDIDFWGMTEYSDARKSFLQSYFLVTKKFLHCSDIFKTYWETMPMIRSIDDSLEFHEFRFSRWFSENGFRYEPYVKNDPDWDGNTTLLDVPEMVARGMPIIKYRAFNFEENIVERRGGFAPERNFRFVAEETDYPVELIWDYIIAHTTSASLTANLDLYRAMPQKPTSHKGPKIAYAITLLEPEQLDIALSYLETLPQDKVFVTTPSREIQVELENRGFNVRQSGISDMGLYIWLEEIAALDGIEYVVNLADFDGERTRYRFIDHLFEVYWAPFAGKENCLDAIETWFADMPRLGMIHPTSDTIDGREFFNKPLGASQLSLLKPDKFKHLRPAVGSSLWPWRGNAVLRHDVIKNPVFADDLTFLLDVRRPHRLSKPAGLEAYFPEIVRGTGHVSGLMSREADVAKIVLRGTSLEATWNARFGKNAEKFRNSLIAAQGATAAAQTEVAKLKAQLSKYEVPSSSESGAVSEKTALASQEATSEGDNINIQNCDVRLKIERWRSPRLVAIAPNGKAMELASRNFAQFSVDEFKQSDSSIKVAGWCFDERVPANKLYCGVFADEELVSPFAWADDLRADVAEVFAEKGVGQDVGYNIRQFFDVDKQSTSQTFRLAILNKELTKFMLIDLSKHRQ